MIRLKKPTTLESISFLKKNSLRRGRDFLKKTKANLLSKSVIISFRYLEDQENKAKEAAAICKQLAEEKQVLTDEINELSKEIQETDSEYRKVRGILTYWSLLYFDLG